MMIDVAVLRRLLLTNEQDELNEIHENAKISWASIWTFWGPRRFIHPFMGLFATHYVSIASAGIDFAALINIYEWNEMPVVQIQDNTVCSVCAKGRPVDGFLAREDEAVD